MRLFFLSFLFTLSAIASDWSQLETGNTYVLSQSFHLRQTERSRSSLEISKGQKLLLKEVVPLAVPGVPLVLFVFDHRNCPGPHMQTEMDVIPVIGSSPLVEVGVYLERCELNIYIENKDLFNKSFFE